MRPLSQSEWIMAALFAGFLIYLAMKGKLGAYWSLLAGGGSPAAAKAAASRSAAASSTGGGIAGGMLGGIVGGGGAASSGGIFGDILSGAGLGGLSGIFDNLSGWFGGTANAASPGSLASQLPPMTVGGTSSSVPPIAIGGGMVSGTVTGDGQTRATAWSLIPGKVPTLPAVRF